MTMATSPAKARAAPFATIMRDTFRVLSFRRPSAEMVLSWPQYLAFGMFMTWLAGMGRYWDNPRAELWQHLGLGSVAYVLVLAMILWGIGLPLQPKVWRYRDVLVFVTLTSPPALLYAIPVERYVELTAAQNVNAWFLGIVATWRVALLGWFLWRMAGLPKAVTAVVTSLPLTLIVVTLAILNLEHVMFDLMAGIRPENRSEHDLTYGVVTLLAIGSLFAAPVLAAAYLWFAVRRHRAA